jgi:hypothetical protein
MNVLLLAPKHSRDGDRLDDVRTRIAECVRSGGHRPIIMENEPDHHGETLRNKFLRLAGECEQAVLVWPPGAAMGTTADEIVLLQEVAERQLMDIALILHESEAEQRDQELHVHSAADRSRYLDGILACRPFIVRWAGGDDFDRALALYADALW